MDYGDCATQSTNITITAEEHKRKLIIHNEERKVIMKKEKLLEKLKSMVV